MSEPTPGVFKAWVKGPDRWFSVGKYDSARAAAIARDRAVLWFGTGDRLNEPAASKRLGALSLEELRASAKLERRAKKTSSRFFGVHWSNYDAKWIASAREGTIGRFDEERDAAIAYDRVVRYDPQGRPQNFPDLKLSPISITDFRAGKALATKERRAQLRKKPVRDRSSFLGRSPYRNRPFKGVYSTGQPDLFEVTLVYQKRTVWLGSYRTPQEGAIAYDRAALHFHGPRTYLNLPDVSRSLGPATPESLRAATWAKFKETTASRYRGVCWCRRTKRWMVWISVANRSQFLGRFDDEVEAALAYDKAAIRFHRSKAKLNFPDEK